MNRNARRLVPVLVIGVAALLAGVAAGSGSTNANHRTANQLAPRLLAALQLPGDASPATGDPSAGRLLANPPSRPGSRNLVDIHRFWVVPGGPRTVLGWVQAHPPHGSQANMTGEAETSRGVTISWVGFWFGPATTALADRELIVTVARASGGGTALRADVQVVWVEARPAWERVPSGVRIVTITVRRLGRPPSAPRTLIGPRAALILHLVNALPAAQPTAAACPADFGPYVQLAFRRRRSTPPVATVVADGSGCGGVTFRLGTRRGAPLSGGRSLVKELSTLLRVLPG